MQCEALLLLNMPAESTSQQPYGTRAPASADAATREGAPLYSTSVRLGLGNNRFQAKRLAWQGFTVAEIARELDVPYTTVSSWKTRDRWDASPISERVHANIDARLVQLINKPNKSNADYKEVDFLMTQLEKVAKIERYGVTGKESHINPKRAGNHRDKRATPNMIPAETIEKMVAALSESLYGYQKVWFANKGHRIRMVLKSRQIGATWYFAREALLDALTTGDNQIFLSASRAQAEVFRGYIVDFAKEFGIELKGNPIVLGNRLGGGENDVGATLYFLSTSSRTAQSYHGHVYFDEIFWVPKFKELRKVASGMAMHKKWRQTYFSTPSSMTHEAYPFWAGKGKKGADIDVSHKALAEGALCADGIWRQIVTVEDAKNSGCDLFDIAQLRLEYTEEEFEQLLMCQFMDDSASIFGFNELLLCGVDSLTSWRDFSRSAARPLGQRKVSIGYDPSRTRDNSAVVVVAHPEAPGGKFRVVEKHEWRGMDFVEQAQKIKEITEKYVVTFIGIDTTGVGHGVYDLVRNFYPAAQSINYSPAVKSRLVLRVKELVRSRRIEWDASWSDLMRAFLAIQRVMTGSGNAITFEAARSALTGHADLAWAVMHALDNQPLNQINPDMQGASSFMQLTG
jgi:uncharacterized protein YjcR